MSKIILILTVPFISFCQKEYIFFEINEDVYKDVDSIVFKNSKIKKFQNFVKFPESRRVKFSYYVDGKKFNIKIKKYYLGKFNTIDSIIINTKSKSQLYIQKGSTTLTMTSKQNTPYYCKLLINVNENLHKDGEFITGSKNFDDAMKDNPSFFLW